MAKIIDGKKISEEILKEVSGGVTNLKKEKGIVPGLATILVGEDPASKVYVGAKIKACEKTGINGIKYQLPKDVSEEELLKKLEELNNDDSVHGILVQLPLPENINISEVVNTISPEKDVDGFHFLNISQLYWSSEADLKTELRDTLSKDMFKPCTPYGIVELLYRYNIDIRNAAVVVVGRSNVIGKPIAYLLVDKVSSLTICHSYTKNLFEVVKRGDIIIAAAGKPKLITGDMVKEGAVVIDVGINRSPEGKIVGDVDFDSVKEKASYITPVPGGVGPMTIAMLLRNTLDSALRKVRRLNL